MGIGQARGQQKMFFLTVGHFYGSESKLVCFISTTEKKHPCFGNITQHKNIFAMRVEGKAVKAHPEENIFSLEFNVLFVSVYK